MLCWSKKAAPWTAPGEPLVLGVPSDEAVQMAPDVPDTDRLALQQRYLELMRVRLPARAAEQAWVIRFDHCFMRVVLDNLFSGQWYEHVPKRPAYRHLTVAQLQAAIASAEAILTQGAPLLEQLNANSLAWRRAAKAAQKAERSQLSLLK